MWQRELRLITPVKCWESDTGRGILDDITRLSLYASPPAHVTPAKCDENKLIQLNGYFHSRFCAVTHVDFSDNHCDTSGLQNANLDIGNKTDQVYSLHYSTPRPARKMISLNLSAR